MSADEGGCHGGSETQPVVIVVPYCNSEKVINQRVERFILGKY